MARNGFDVFSASLADVVVDENVEEGGAPYERTDLAMPRDDFAELSVRTAAETQISDAPTTPLATTSEAPDEVDVDKELNVPTVLTAAANASNLTSLPLGGQIAYSPNKTAMLLSGKIARIYADERAANYTLSHAGFSVRAAPGANKVFVESTTGWHGWVSQKTLEKNPGKYKTIDKATLKPSSTPHTKAVNHHPVHKLYDADPPMPVDAHMDEVPDPAFGAPASKSIPALSGMQRGQGAKYNTYTAKDGTEYKTITMGSGLDEFKAVRWSAGSDLTSFCLPSGMFVPVRTNDHKGMFSIVYPAIPPRTGVDAENVLKFTPEQCGQMLMHGTVDWMLATEGTIESYGVDASGNVTSAVLPSRSFEGVMNTNADTEAPPANSAMRTMLDHIASGALTFDLADLSSFVDHLDKIPASKWKAQVDLAIGKTPFQKPEVLAAATEKAMNRKATIRATLETLVSEALTKKNGGIPVTFKFDSPTLEAVAPPAMSDASAPGALPPPDAKLPSKRIPGPAQMTDIGDASDMGGAKEGKRKLRDQNGNEYLFKLAKPSRAAVQQAVGDMSGLIVPEGEYVPCTFMEMNGNLGSVQPILADVVGDGKKLGFQVEKFSPQQLKDIQREAVLDWVFSNHDGHKGNVLLLQNGRMIGIDKEQAFRYMVQTPEAEKLDVNYHPNSSYGELEPLKNTMYRAYAEGKITLDPHDVLPYLQQLESVSDAKWIEAVSPYVDTLAAEKSFSPEKKQQLIARIVGRKNSTREDFRQLFSKLETQRTGAPVNFVFKDEQQAAPAPVVQQAPAVPSEVAPGTEIAPTPPAAPAQGKGKPTGKCPKGHNTFKSPVPQNCPTCGRAMNPLGDHKIAPREPMSPQKLRSAMGYDDHWFISAMKAKNPNYLGKPFQATPGKIMKFVSEFAANGNFCLVSGNGYMPDGSGEEFKAIDEILADIGVPKAHRGAVQDSLVANGIITPVTTTNSLGNKAYGYALVAKGEDNGTDPIGDVNPPDFDPLKMLMDGPSQKQLTPADEVNEAKIPTATCPDGHKTYQSPPPDKCTQCGKPLANIGLAQALGIVEKLDDSLRQLEENYGVVVHIDTLAQVMQTLAARAEYGQRISVPALSALLGLSGDKGEQAIDTLRNNGLIDEVSDLTEAEPSYMISSSAMHPDKPDAQPAPMPELAPAPMPEMAAPPAKPKSPVNSPEALEEATSEVLDSILPIIDMSQGSPADVEHWTKLMKDDVSKLLKMLSYSKQKGNVTMTHLYSVLQNSPAGYQDVSVDAIMKKLKTDGVFTMADDGKYTATPGPKGVELLNQIGVTEYPQQEDEGPKVPPAVLNDASLAEGLKSIGVDPNLTPAVMSVIQESNMPILFVSKLFQKGVKDPAKVYKMLMDKGLVSHSKTENGTKIVAPSQAVENSSDAGSPVENQDMVAPTDEKFDDATQPVENPNTENQNALVHKPLDTNAIDELAQELKLKPGSPVHKALELLNASPKPLTYKDVITQLTEKHDQTYGMVKVMLAKLVAQGKVSQVTAPDGQVSYFMGDVGGAPEAATGPQAPSEAAAPLHDHLRNLGVKPNLAPDIANALTALGANGAEFTSGEFVAHVIANGDPAVGWYKPYANNWIKKLLAKKGVVSVTPDGKYKVNEFPENATGQCPKGHNTYLKPAPDHCPTCGTPMAPGSGAEISAPVPEVVAPSPPEQVQEQVTLDPMATPEVAPVPEAAADEAMPDVSAPTENTENMSLSESVQDVLSTNGLYGDAEKIAERLDALIQNPQTKLGISGSEMEAQLAACGCTNAHKTFQALLDGGVIEKRPNKYGGFGYLPANAPKPDVVVDEFTPTTKLVDQFPDAATLTQSIGLPFFMSDVLEGKDAALTEAMAVKERVSAAFMQNRFVEIGLAPMEAELLFKHMLDNGAIYPYENAVTKKTHYKPADAWVANLVYGKEAVDAVDAKARDDAAMHMGMLGATAADYAVDVVMENAVLTPSMSEEDFEAALDAVTLEHSGPKYVGEYNAKAINALVDAGIMERTPNGLTFRVFDGLKKIHEVETDTGFAVPEQPLPAASVTEDAIVTPDAQPTATCKNGHDTFKSPVPEQCPTCGVSMQEQATEPTENNGSVPADAPMLTDIIKEIPCNTSDEPLVFKTLTELKKKYGDLGDYEGFKKDMLAAGVKLYVVESMVEMGLVSHDGKLLFNIESEPEAPAPAPVTEKAKKVPTGTIASVLAQIGVPENEIDGMKNVLIKVKKDHPEGMSVADFDQEMDEAGVEGWEKIYESGVVSIEGDSVTGFATFNYEVTSSEEPKNYSPDVEGLKSLLTDLGVSDTSEQAAIYLGLTKLKKSGLNAFPMSALQGALESDTVTVNTLVGALVTAGMLEKVDTYVNGSNLEGPGGPKWVLKFGGDIKPPQPKGSMSAELSGVLGDYATKYGPTLLKIVETELGKAAAGKVDLYQFMKGMAVAIHGPIHGSASGSLTIAGAMQTMLFEGGLISIDDNGKVAAATLQSEPTATCKNGHNTFLQPIPKNCTTCGTSLAGAAALAKAIADEAGSSEPAPTENTENAAPETGILPTATVPKALVTTAPYIPSYEHTKKYHDYLKQLLKSDANMSAWEAVYPGLSDELAKIVAHQKLSGSAHVNGKAVLSLIQGLGVSAQDAPKCLELMKHSQVVSDSTASYSHPGDLTLMSKQDEVTGTCPNGHSTYVTPKPKYCPTCGKAYALGAKQPAYVLEASDLTSMIAKNAAGMPESAQKVATYLAENVDVNGYITKDAVHKTMVALGMPVFGAYKYGAAASSPSDEMYAALKHYGVIKPVPDTPVCSFSIDTPAKPGVPYSTDAAATGEIVPWLEMATPVQVAKAAVDLEAGGPKTMPYHCLDFAMTATTPITMAKLFSAMIPAGPSKVTQNKVEKLIKAAIHSGVLAYDKNTEMFFHGGWKPGINVADTVADETIAQAPLSKLLDGIEPDFQAYHPGISLMIEDLLNVHNAAGKAIEQKDILSKLMDADLTDPVLRIHILKALVASGKLVKKPGTATQFTVPKPISVYNVTNPHVAIVDAVNSGIAILPSSSNAAKHSKAISVAVAKRMLQSQNTPMLRKQFVSAIAQSFIEAGAQAWIAEDAAKLVLEELVKVNSVTEKDQFVRARGQIETVTSAGDPDWTKTENLLKTKLDQPQMDTLKSELLAQPDGFMSYEVLSDALDKMGITSLSEGAAISDLLISAGVFTPSGDSGDYMFNSAALKGETIAANAVPDCQTLDAPTGTCPSDHKTYKMPVPFYCPTCGKKMQASAAVPVNASVFNHYMFLKGASNFSNTTMPPMPSIVKVLQGEIDDMYVEKSGIAEVYEPMVAYGSTSFAALSNGGKEAALILIKHGILNMTTDGKLLHGIMKTTGSDIPFVSHEADAETNGEITPLALSKYAQIDFAAMLTNNPLVPPSIKGNIPNIAKLLDKVLENGKDEGIDAAGVASLLGWTADNVSWQLDQLVKAGLVEQNNAGNYFIGGWEKAAPKPPVDSPKPVATPAKSLLQTYTVLLAKGLDSDTASDVSDAIDSHFGFEVPHLVMSATSYFKNVLGYSDPFQLMQTLKKAGALTVNGDGDTLTFTSPLVNPCSAPKGATVEFNLDDFNAGKISATCSINEFKANEVQSLLAHWGDVHCTNMLNALYAVAGKDEPFEVKDVGVYDKVKPELEVAVVDLCEAGLLKTFAYVDESGDTVTKYMFGHWEKSTDEPLSPPAQAITPTGLCKNGHKTYVAPMPHNCPTCGVVMNGMAGGLKELFIEQKLTHIHMLASEVAAFITQDEIPITLDTIAENVNITPQFASKLMMLCVAKGIFETHNETDAGGFAAASTYHQVKSTPVVLTAAPSDAVVVASASTPMGDVAKPPQVGYSAMDAVNGTIKPVITEYDPDVLNSALLAKLPEKMSSNTLIASKEMVGLALSTLAFHQKKSNKPMTATDLAQLMTEDGLETKPIAVQIALMVAVNAGVIKSIPDTQPLQFLHGYWTLSSAAPAAPISAAVQPKAIEPPTSEAFAKIMGTHLDESTTAFVSAFLSANDGKTPANVDVMGAFFDAGFTPGQTSSVLKKLQSLGFISDMTETNWKLHYPDAAHDADIKGIADLLGDVEFDKSGHSENKAYHVWKALRDTQAAPGFHTYSDLNVKLCNAIGCHVAEADDIVLKLMNAGILQNLDGEQDMTVVMPEQVKDLAYVSHAVFASVYPMFEAAFSDTDAWSHMPVGLAAKALVAVQNLGPSFGIKHLAEQMQMSIAEAKQVAEALEKAGVLHIDTFDDGGFGTVTTVVLNRVAKQPTGKCDNGHKTYLVPIPHYCTTCGMLMSHAAPSKKVSLPSSVGIEEIAKSLAPLKMSPEKATLLATKLHEAGPLTDASVGLAITEAMAEGGGTLKTPVEVLVKQLVKKNILNEFLPGQYELTATPASTELTPDSVGATPAQIAKHLADTVGKYNMKAIGNALYTNGGQAIIVNNDGSLDFSQMLLSYQAEHSDKYNNAVASFLQQKSKEQSSKLNKVDLTTKGMPKKEPAPAPKGVEQFSEGAPELDTSSLTLTMPLVGKPGKAPASAAAAEAEEIELHVYSAAEAMALVPGWSHGGKGHAVAKALFTNDELDFPSLLEAARKHLSADKAATWNENSLKAVITYGLSAKVIAVIPGTNPKQYTLGFYPDAKGAPSANDLQMTCPDSFIPHDAPPGSDHRSYYAAARLGFDLHDSAQREAWEASPYYELIQGLAVNPRTGKMLALQGVSKDTLKKLVERGIVTQDTLHAWRDVMISQEDSTGKKTWVEAVDQATFRLTTPPSVLDRPMTLPPPGVVVFGDDGRVKDTKVSPQLKDAIEGAIFGINGSSADPRSVALLKLMSADPGRSWGGTMLQGIIDISKLNDLVSKDLLIIEGDTDYSHPENANYRVNWPLVLSATKDTNKPVCSKCDVRHRDAHMCPSQKPVLKTGVPLKVPAPGAYVVPISDTKVSGLSTIGVMPTDDGVAPLTLAEAKNLLKTQGIAVKKGSKIAHLIELCQTPMNSNDISVAMTNLGFKGNANGAVKEAIDAGVITKLPSGKFVLKGHGNHVVLPQPGETGPLVSTATQQPEPGLESIRRQFAADHPIQAMAPHHAKRLAELMTYMRDSVDTDPTPVMKRTIGSTATHLAKRITKGMLDIVHSGNGSWASSAHNSPYCAFLCDTAEQIGLATNLPYQKSPSIKPKPGDGKGNWKPIGHTELEMKELIVAHLTSKGITIPGQPHHDKMVAVSGECSIVVDRDGVITLEKENSAGVETANFEKNVLPGLQAVISERVAKERQVMSKMFADLGLDASKYLQVSFNSKRFYTNPDDPDAPMVARMNDYELDQYDTTKSVARPGVHTNNQYALIPSRAEMLMQQYAVTQAALISQNLTSTNIYRGVYPHVKDMMVERASKRQGLGAQIAVRGVTGWTVDTSTALNFTKSYEPAEKSGVILHNEAMPTHRMYIHFGQKINDQPVFGGMSTETGGGEREVIIFGHQAITQKPIVGKKFVRIAALSKRAQAQAEKDEPRLFPAPFPDTDIPDGFGRYVTNPDGISYWVTNTEVKVYFSAGDAPDEPSKPQADFEFSVSDATGMKQ